MGSEKERLSLSRSSLQAAVWGFVGWLTPGKMKFGKLDDQAADYTVNLSLRTIDQVT